MYLSRRSYEKFHLLTIISKTLCLIVFLDLFVINGAFKAKRGEKEVFLRDCYVL